MASISLCFSFGLIFFMVLRSVLNDAQPILGYLDTKLLSIQKVDGVEQSFVADFYLTLYFQPPGWTKTQLPDGEAIDPAVVDANNFPIIEFENANDYQSKYVTHYFASERPTRELQNFQDVQYDDELPWVKQDSRYTGTFRTVLPLRNFPFDVQQINLNVEVSNLDNTTFKFVASLNSTFASKLGNSLQEWDVVTSVVTVTDIYYDTWDQYFSRGRFGLELRRQSGYYVTKIVVGLAFLIVMEMATFAIEPSGPDRIAGSITVFLAMVAYLFVVSSDVPKISYNTRLDDYVSLCMVLVTIATIYHAAISVACRLTAATRETAEVETSGRPSSQRSDDSFNPAKPLTNNYLPSHHKSAEEGSPSHCSNDFQSPKEDNVNHSSGSDTPAQPRTASSSSEAKTGKRSQQALTVHEKMVKYSLRFDLVALILMLSVFLISAVAILSRTG
jgi:hypothetical protein